MSEPLRIQREPLAEESAAFRLALQAWPEAERKAQEGAMLAIEPARRFDVIVLGGRRGGELVAAVLGQKLAGKAAHVWPPQPAAADEQAAAALLSALEDSLRQAGMELSQALLSSADDVGPARLQAGGYRRAARLLYLTCEQGNFPSQVPDSSDFEWQARQPKQAETFLRVIEETYEGTLDSPILTGMRSTRDVVEGYEKVGEFEPDHWLLLRPRLSCEFAGCLILARHSPETMELIYMGITPKFRGRRLGHLLARHAQWLAGRAGCERLVLAVDADNEPALAMYAASGFWAWDERACWVKDLRRAAAATS